MTFYDFKLESEFSLDIFFFLNIFFFTANGNVFSIYLQLSDWVPILFLLKYF